MTAPSNANTSGLGDVGLSETYRFAYESIRNGAPGLSDVTCAAIARSINMKVSLAANVTAASAQARIADLERWQAAAIRSARIHDENIREFDARATAAEARAERLKADKLAIISLIEGACKLPPQSAVNTLREATRLARAALQQETQP